MERKAKIEKLILNKKVRDKGKGKINRKEKSRERP